MVVCNHYYTTTQSLRSNKYLHLRYKHGRKDQTQNVQKLENNPGMSLCFEAFTERRC